MLAGVTAIIFDLDGTLYRNDDFALEIKLSAGRYIASLKGLDNQAANALLENTRARLSAEDGLEASLTAACEELGGDIRQLHQHFIREIKPEQYLERDDRVVSFLRKLSQRFDLYMYTNNNLELSRRIVEILGIAEFFREIFTIEDHWRPKPDRSALESIFSRIGRAPAECLFVGDRYAIDLQLPATMGSAVFLARSVEELFPLLQMLS